MAKKLIQVVYQVNDAALIKAQSSILANETAAKKADEAVKKYGRDAKKAGDDASKSFMNLGNIWKGLVAVGIVAFFASLAKKTFELGAKQEQLNIAFTTFLGSAEKAKKLLAELNKFALVTPFTPDQVNNAAKSLLAFGTAGDKIIPTLKMLGDISAGTGKDLSELAVIYGQISSTGRLMGQDLLQLINAGFNPLQEISKATGRSMQALKKDMEAGNISIEMVEAAFKRATSEGGLFFNLTEKQSKSVLGLLSTVEGNIDEILKNLFTASSGPVKGFVQMLVDLSSRFLEMSENAEQFEQRIKLSSMESYVNKFKELAKASTDVNKRGEERVAELEKESNGIKAITGNWDVLLSPEQQRKHEVRLAQIQLEQKAITEYLAALKAGNDAEWAKKLAESQERQAEAMKKLNAERKKEREERAKEMEKPADEGDISPIDVAARGLLGYTADDAEAAMDAALEEQEDGEAKQREAKALFDAAELKAEELKQKQLKELRQQGRDLAVDLITQALLTSIDANAREVEVNIQRQQTLIGLSEEERKLKLKEFAEEDRLRREQAKREQNVTIKKILIESALNAVKALGTPPVPNFVAAALALGHGIAMSTIVKAQGFKEGVIGLNGRGSGKSDSIPAMLSKGESVITAEATARSRNLLEAVQDHRIDDRLLSKLKVSKEGISINFDNKEVAKSVDRLLAVDHYEQGHFNYKIIKKGETLTQHIRSKYHS